MTDELETLIVRGYRYARALTHDSAQAEDLVQDAWLAILRRGAPRHVGYLFRTIRNRFLDLEKRRRLVAVEPLESATTVETPTPTFAIDPRDLARSFGALRAGEREALYLAVVEGYTTAEVATLTEQPLGTTSSLIQRAKAKLRRTLRDEQERRHG